MAPSRIIGTPWRTLVRVPGSGFNKMLKPIHLEIAQITSFQMENVIPRRLLPPPAVRPYNIFRDSGRGQTNAD